MGGKKRKSSEDAKKLPVSDAQKLKIANLVEQNEMLWKISHQDYRRSDKKLIVWKNIAEIMDMTVSQCKSTWKSMTDSLRYHTKKINKEKSGAGAPDNEEDDEAQSQTEDKLENWTFYECLKFLNEEKPTRKTLSSTLPKDGETLDNDDIDFDSQLVDPEEDGETSNTAPKSQNKQTPVSTPSTSKVQSSNYNYMVDKKPRYNDKHTEDLVSGINELINIRKEKSQANKGLKHNAMLANLDQMLQKLPDEIVDDLNVQFVNLTHQALKAQRQIVMNFNE